ncbi:enoyl-CoA hydratase [Arcanobacterium wilhelmae]|uniref:Enoyl-CoA hydratase n=1 Tax=Arcanobacterium wilhelmae TaxID=1803177 RepID=A0ABT9NAN3_9ACTO|nr:enoyl-CoA hydratase-related protein [Arcanobacterium wilhelmae]MDP9800755.1 enoyl-CoA hydratase [Arcanobacterium wilhelmae]
MENSVLVEVEGPIATIVINRPEVLNAINYDVLDGLEAAIDQVAADDGVRVVIVTGAGERSFVAGADIALLQDMDPFAGKAYCERGQAVYSKLEKLPKPVIAAINGFALGGGSELALACDIRIASSKAKFGLPEVGLGVIPGFGGTQRLPRLIGVGYAKELILTGEIIRADRAAQIGLVNRVVEPEELTATVRELAQAIASKSSVALSFAKDSINRGIQMDLDTAIAMEAVQFAVAFSSDDRAEGIGAFLAKRTPDFSK